ncbi:UNVERIFIED_CONTAM: Guanine nucleotide exchange factor SPIKE 1, partial [Sesamum radiatum]
MLPTFSWASREIAVQAASSDFSAVPPRIADPLLIRSHFIGFRSLTSVFLMENALATGLRFRKIPRQSFSNCFQMDPLILKDGFLNYFVEMELANARRSRIQDSAEEETASTSGSHLSGSNFYNSSNGEISKLCHFGEPPLPAYEPVFDWDNERSTIFGQRIPAANIFSIPEPFYGTICLYNRERREKLSEDFIFHMLPAEMQDTSSSVDARGIFRVDVPSASICLLVQLEKPATEEGGVTSSVYSRKEPVHLSEREKQKLQVWSRIMPYRESFAWAIIPLFDSGVTSASAGPASPSSPLITSISGSSSQEGAAEPVSKITLDGKLGYSSGNSVVVEVSNLSKVKESYTEESLLDPKRKIHKPVKGVLRLEIEKLQSGLVDSEKSVESRSVNGDMAGHLVPGTTFTKCPSYRTDGRQSAYLDPHSSDRIELDGNGLISHGLTDTEPSDAMHPREPGSLHFRNGHTQVAVGARVACYHDEIKVSLPAIWTPMHHLLFTFFHVDLQTKIEVPKPVVVGYASLPLSTYAQLKSEISLPIMRELVPHYLQDSSRERVDYLEDGKNVFRLRLRLCSSLYPISERIRDFFLEYDRHILRTSPPWGSELLEAINSLKNVDSTALLQFLQPILNMLLHLIGNGGETLQVAAFRAMVNILTRVQQESVDDGERNLFLVNYVDFAFDDFGGRQPPVYPGLSTVWGSLARSKAKGYRVGPVYDDVLAMAWFFLELVVKSMALEQTRLFYHNLPSGEDVPPMQLKEGVFRCIMQLYDCLLTEVHERCKKGLGLAKYLNNSLAFFCYDLLSTIEPRQVFELVSLYLDKFSGVCQSVLHDCKLTFLQILCDHDLFVEMPGRDPSDRNYLSSVLIQEIFLTWDHEDLAMRAKAARILVVLLCKHEFDVRYQKMEDKLYIAQLYFPLVGQILDEMPVFYNLGSTEKREVLIAVLQIIRNLDDASLIKAWQQSIARTRLFFKLLEECLIHFEHRKPDDSMLMGSSSRSPLGDKPFSSKYSDRLSPAINHYLLEAARQEVGELWEENLSASVSLQVLEIIEKFSGAVASHTIATDYGKLDCITSIFMIIFSHNQPLAFWKALFPVFNNVFELHGATLMARENDRFLKQIAFHLLRLAVFRNENIRRRAVIGLQILVRSSFSYFRQTARLRVVLTITLSELMSEVQVTHMKSDGTLEESGEARRLRKSLEEMADESKSVNLLTECGLPEKSLLASCEQLSENCWSWSEVKVLSDSLLSALDASLEHALLASVMTLDRYAAAESFYKLAMAFAPVPDLHIMWLLHLCDAHQEMQSWAEAAQCAVAVAGVVMQ